MAMNAMTSTPPRTHSSSGLGFYSNSSKERLESDQGLPPARLRPPPPHLPFRRISMPSIAAAQIQNRPDSVTSIVSYDSVPEEQKSASTMRGAPSAPPSSFNQRSRPNSVVSNGGSHADNGASSRTKLRTRTSSSRSRNRDNTTPVINEEMLETRRQVIMEIYQSERVYSEGLNMIYEVCKARRRRCSVILALTLCLCCSIS